MSTAVLRVSSPDLNVETTRARLPPELVDRVWFKGTARLGGRGPHPDSGVSLFLCEADDNVQLVQRICDALAAVADEVAQLVKAGALAQLDIALYVGGLGMEFVRLDAKLLRRALDAGVEIAVSAYPVSDDDE
jgi:hypothetical protein